METYWVTCPLCKGKTRLKLLPNTVLKNYPALGGNGLIYGMLGGLVVGMLIKRES